MVAVYIVSGVALLGVISLLAGRLIRSNTRKGKHIEEIKGVRYTTSDQTLKEPDENENMEAKISFNTRDILIPVKKEMVVGKNDDIKPANILYWPQWKKKPHLIFV